MVGVKPYGTGLSHSLSTKMSHVASSTLAAGVISDHSVLAVVRGNVVFVWGVFSTFCGLTCTECAVSILATLDAAEPLTHFFVYQICTDTVAEYEVSRTLYFMGRDGRAYRIISVRKSSDASISGKNKEKIP